MSANKFRRNHVIRKSLLCNPQHSSNQFRPGSSMEAQTTDKLVLGEQDIYMILNYPPQILNLKREGEFLLKWKNVAATTITR